jgi:hypothetical protein
MVMGRYIRLRDCNLTSDERIAYSILMARANGLLDGRRIIAIEILKQSKKRCEWNLKRDHMYKYCWDYPLGPYTPERPCGKPASIRLICTYGEAKFSVYLCERHFKRLLRRTALMVEADMRKIFETVEEIRSTQTLKQG